MLDPEIAHAVTDDCRFAAGDHRYLDTAIEQHANAVTVERIESLVFFAAVIELQAAIGQHAVDVEDEQANRGWR